MTADNEDWTGVDPERLAVHEAVMKLMAITGSDYLTAAQHVEMATREAERAAPLKAALAASAAAGGGLTHAVRASRPAGGGIATLLDGGPVVLVTKGTLV